MRDPKRIEKILSSIREIWYTYPDLRLMQLILNALNDVQADPYYIEDNELEQKLKEYKNKL